MGIVFKGNGRGEVTLLILYVEGRFEEFVTQFFNRKVMLYYTLEY